MDKMIGINPNPLAKIQQEKDICKVLDYFRYKVGTSLDVALSTGILRNSVTWYIAQLEELGELQAICVCPDRHTGFKAKHYSADRTKWPQKSQKRELDLFPDTEKEVQYGRL